MICLFVFKKEECDETETETGDGPKRGKVERRPLWGPRTKSCLHVAISLVIDGDVLYVGRHLCRPRPGAPAQEQADQ